MMLQRCWEVEGGGHGLQMDEEGNWGSARERQPLSRGPFPLPLDQGDVNELAVACTPFNSDALFHLTLRYMQSAAHKMKPLKLKAKMQSSSLAGRFSYLCQAFHHSKENVTKGT